eukprot:COSAG05_NODE_369_length_10717_cov_6.865135_1_plen_65_part_00
MTMFPADLHADDERPTDPLSNNIAAVAESVAIAAAAAAVAAAAESAAAAAAAAAAVATKGTAKM